jgi:hypothetical protein
MIFTVPNSFGTAPLVERNTCHGPGRGHPCSTHGLVKGIHGGTSYLQYDLERAGDLGIAPEEILNPIPDYVHQSHSQPHEKTPRVEIFIDTERQRLPKKVRPKRGVEVSVLRHEIGHVTDRAYGSKDEKKGWLQDRSAALLGGHRFSPRYVSEIGAWKAAIRDSPHNRVDWRDMQAALASYLRDEAPRLITSSRKAWVARHARAHTALLKRYAQRLRKQALTPKAKLDPVPPKDWQMGLR